MYSKKDEVLLELIEHGLLLVEQVDKASFKDEKGHDLVNCKSYQDFANKIDVYVGMTKEAVIAMFDGEKASSQAKLDCYTPERYVEAVSDKFMISYDRALQMADDEGVAGDLVALGEIIDEEFVISPTYMTDKAVGADCFASEDITIKAGEIKIVPTGIKAKFNGDNEGLFPFIRSSVPRKKGLMLANGVGVVEEDYYGNPDNDGNIGFMFFNMGHSAVTIKRFERIGQIVLMPILRFDNAGRAGMARGASGSTGK